MRLLLDTNVLLDFVADRMPFASDVRKLCIASSFGDVQLWVSAQSYADAYCVLRNSASESDVKRALLATLEFFVPCGTYAADLKPALESDWHDLEDYLIAFSSKRVDADFFITRDAEVAQKCPVPVMTAHDFIQYLETEHGLVYEDIDF